MLLHGFFKGCTPHVNDSIEKNFVVKLLYWFDMVGAELMQDWDFRCSMKIVFSNIIKKAGISLLLLAHPDGGRMYFAAMSIGH